MSGDWQDKIIDHAIEKAQGLRAQLQTPESRWKDKTAGLKEAGKLVFDDESLPIEFRECLAELLWMVYALAKLRGPVTREDDLYWLVQTAQNVGRVVREADGRLLS